MGFFEALDTIPPQLEELLHRLNRDGPPVTCLISDIAITVPTQRVADKFKIPRIAFYTCSASFQLLVSYVVEGKRTSAKLALEGLQKERTSLFCDILPGLPSLLNRDLPDWNHVVDDNAFMWRLISQTWQQSEHRAHAMVINTFKELEAPVFQALLEGFRLPMYGIGPLAQPLQKSTSLWREDETCITWLDKQSPLSVLYISFGSIVGAFCPSLHA
ncbi:hypothetical protein KP509_21G025300 [Ceratopteris richardii]|uniref:Uncharacterized protein n=1 Tax=Ceratopteris richardii TaxID=49495 RepID=A0A8T2SBP7_CERRI|nr:hypothetical protein KP509_21G025300 [Ceratopteris richardii]